MSLIQLYELKFIDIEEFSNRLHGVVDESLEAVYGFDCLTFYVQMVNKEHSFPFFIPDFNAKKRKM